MMAANDSMLAGDEEKFGKLPVSGILANLQATQVTGGLIFQAGHLWHGADAASDDYRQYCL